MSDNEKLKPAWVPPWRRVRGLGDLVAAVAQPIAGIIDTTLGTDLQNCISCEQRREDLNEKFPIPSGEQKKVD